MGEEDPGIAAGNQKEEEQREPERHEVARGEEGAAAKHDVAKVGGMRPPTLDRQIEAVAVGTGVLGPVDRRNEMKWHRFWVSLD